MQLTIRGSVLTFREVALRFVESGLSDLFAYKNNKTLLETIDHPRYKKLAIHVRENYSSELNSPLGEVLNKLKLSGDQYFKKFLNRYGDMNYCIFQITQPEILSMKGLYLYLLNDDLKYVGRARDSYKNRINQGYGKIHPKNCYLDGQATNCRLNALIGESQKSIRFFVCPLSNDAEILEYERELIDAYHPPWNLL